MSSWESPESPTEGQEARGKGIHLQNELVSGSKVLCKAIFFLDQASVRVVTERDSPRQRERQELLSCPRPEVNSPVPRLRSSYAPADPKAGIITSPKRFFLLSKQLLCSPFLGAFNGFRNTNPELQIPPGQFTGTLHLPQKFLLKWLYFCHKQSLWGNGPFNQQL